MGAWLNSERTWGLNGRPALPIFGFLRYVLEWNLVFFELRNVFRGHSYDITGKSNSGYRNSAEGSNSSNFVFFVWYSNEMNGTHNDPWISGKVFAHVNRQRVFDYTAW